MKFKDWNQCFNLLKSFSPPDISCLANCQNAITEPDKILELIILKQSGVGSNALKSNIPSVISMPWLASRNSGNFWEALPLITWWSGRFLPLARSCLPKISLKHSLWFELREYVEFWIVGSVDSFNPKPLYPEKVSNPIIWRWLAEQSLIALEFSSKIKFEPFQVPKYRNCPETLRAKIPECLYKGRSRKNSSRNSKLDSAFLDS